MKVNLQKIIALIAVLAVTVSILNIMAYATDTSSDTMTSKEYRVAQSNLIDKYVNGDITFTQFQEQSQAVTDDFIARNTVDGVVAESALTVGNTMTAVTKKVANAVKQYGDDARNYVKDWWNDACNKHNVPTETTQTSTTDLHGCGAGYVDYNDNGINLGHYGDYVVIKMGVNPTTGVATYTITLYNQHSIYCFQKQWGYAEGYMVDERPSNGVGGLSEAGLSKYKWYGDVRYEGFDEGEEPPPNDDFVYGTIKKFDEMNDKEINDLLNDFAEEMERQNPDLSSLEGLLKAIYARMGKLDSDNDNDLLNAINANILALVQADKDKTEKDTETNEQLVNTLLEVRDSLKNGTFGTAPEAHGHEISGTVYNVIPLDKNFINKIFTGKTNLKVQYDGTTYYLEDCGCLKLGDKYYNIDVNYDSYAFADYDFTNSNVEIDEDRYVNVDFSNYNTLVAGFSVSQKKKIDNVVDLIYKMVSQAVPYGVITSSFAPYEGIIFNISEPQDIVLNFDSTDTFGGFSATILSVSFFQNQYVAVAMNIVKPFLTVIIGYAWLKVMRRKAVGMLR